MIHITIGKLPSPVTSKKHEVSFMWYKKWQGAACWQHIFKIYF